MKHKFLWFWSTDKRSELMAYNMRVDLAIAVLLFSYVAWLYITFGILDLLLLSLAIWNLVEFFIHRKKMIHWKRQEMIDYLLDPDETLPGPLEKD